MSALAPKDPLSLMTMEEKFKAASALADWWKGRYEAAQKSVEVLDEIGHALERRGYAHMTNGADIGLLIDQLEWLQHEHSRLTGMVNDMTERHNKRNS